MTRASEVLWHGPVLRKDKDNKLRKTLSFEVFGRGEQGGPKITVKRKMYEHTELIKLKREDATNRTKWCNAAMNFIEHDMNPAISVNGDKTGIKSLFSFFHPFSLSFWQLTFCFRPHNSY